MKKKRKKTSNKNILYKEILTSVHRDRREEEIQTFGHSICHNKIFKNKKKYTRKVKHSLNFED